MNTSPSIDETYQGVEQGPIRPPSEANSLMIRITRNCPWNRCMFCPLYKGTRFSIRPTAHVKKDIDTICKYIEMLRQETPGIAEGFQESVRKISERVPASEQQAFRVALHWYAGGMKSVFLQDANSMIIKPAELVDILNHIKARFPGVERITSYARSKTVAGITDDDLKQIAEAGLNRIHIGLESGSDAVLKMIKKGATQAVHIEAGIKVRRAGMELSEYFMPGLGGVKLSREHALETAKALNQINPDFIRLRTLAVPSQTPLADLLADGSFEKCTDRQAVEEILLVLENLKGITSYVVSDHILNLFQEVEGRLPEDKDRMTAVLKTFLSMPPDDQMVYQVGRRFGIFSGLADMNVPRLKERAEDACRQYHITPDNVDDMVDQIMTRFI